MSEFARILIDATAIPPNRGGVGRYLEFLIPALAASGAEVTVLVQAHDADWMRVSAPTATVVPVSARLTSRPLRLLWEQLVLPWRREARRAQVIFSPHYTMPLLAPRPVVVTLHDATFFSHPHLHGRFKRVFFRTWTRLSLARAARCIVPSDATRSEVVAWARPRHPRITVAHHGVDTTRFHVPSDAESARAREVVGGSEWVAFLGTLEPRKNVGSLVRAFGLVSPQHPGLRLVLAGGKGWDDELRRTIDTSPVRERILETGFVDDDALAGLLGDAQLVAYPSLGEGFGLPVLEAMACGAPVLTTDRLALPEVGGDVAVYTEPDAGAIAAALQGMLSAPADRADRSRRGLERAAAFTWSACARIHLEAFSGAAAQPAGSRA